MVEAARIVPSTAKPKPASEDDPPVAPSGREGLPARREQERKPAQAPAATGEAEPKPPASPPPRRRIRSILFLALPAALVVGAYFYVTGGRIMSTENAYLRADTVSLSTDVSGIVKDVAVRDNQRVAAGDVLFRLDDLPFRLALTRAEAQIGTVDDQLGALKASYKDMQAQILQAQADVDFYTRDLARQQDLVSRSIASQATFDQSKRNLEASRQKVASLKQQLAGIVANLAGDPNIPIEKHPRHIDAVAQRDEAARQLAHTVVRAPTSGIVTNVPALQPGQYLAAATPAFSLVAVDRMWVEASPKETELTYVKPGQKVVVTVDAYPGEEWTGTVESVSPASAATFSLLPAQNTSGNWVKVVQRIPMRVVIETSKDKPPLRVGMSAVVEVDTGHPRGVPPFLARLLGGAGPGPG